MTTLVSEQKLKSLFKTAMKEVLEERQDWMRDLVRDAVEDVAMIRAIEEGKKSPLIDRARVMNVLRRK